MSADNTEFTEYLGHAAKGTYMLFDIHSCEQVKWATMYMSRNSFQIHCTFLTSQRWISQHGEFSMVSWTQAQAWYSISLFRKHVKNQS